ncbi:conserved hypothetical protein [Streptomyces sp. SPB074]|nr:conserved hypothetical protein [Streptomyces sp. SPB074]
MTLPTDRECVATLGLLAEEAAYAVEHFDVEVHLLVLDSSAPRTRAAHRAALRELSLPARVCVHHFGEDEQRAFLRHVLDGTGDPKAELLLDLMLPSAPSYGACTNRAFLLSLALGCVSVHRRDSDSRYQEYGGEKVFPIHHELRALGARAADLADAVDECDLSPVEAARAVSLVGASFVGPPSVDIAEIAALDPEAYHDVVSLWAPADASEEEKRELVAESFLGAGNDAFEGDHALLTRVDPMRVDMCNIAFQDVHARVPLPPATNTIGSDYFLLHLVHHAGLPGVLHNRHIVNYYTGERRTDAGFRAYQTRFVKFLLSMAHLHPAYAGLARAGSALLLPDGTVDAERVAAIVRRAAVVDPAENVERLDRIDDAYRRLGGRYADFAGHLRRSREPLPAEARADMEDFALLIDTWPALVAGARRAGPAGLRAAQEEI